MDFLFAPGTLFPIVSKMFVSLRGTDVFYDLTHFSSVLELDSKSCFSSSTFAYLL